MSIHASKLQNSKTDSVTAHQQHCSARWRNRGLSVPTWLFGILVAIGLIMVQGSPAHAQASPTPTPTPIANPCPPAMTGQALIPVPEIVSQKGKLRGTVILSDEPEWMVFRVPPSAPTSTSRSQCLPQQVRIFRELGAVPNPSPAPAPSGPYSKQSFAFPRPGPTLRAKIGDLVELTFINQINPSNFPQSMDRGETGVGGGCDESNAGYPGKPPGGDTFPDCFHGSSTGNIHFHGTHTNPGSTGDNVFIEVRPSPIVNKQPTVTPESVQRSFDAFFAKCEAKVTAKGLEQWPRSWNDLPNYWTDEQKKLLKEYDAKLEKDYPTSGVKKLWPVDEVQLKQGAWPQYYIGAYPYCFRLPAYGDTPARPAAMVMGAGTMSMSEDSRVLMMGQAPGTHWYHAHKHGSTAINVANGMTGAFIIEGQYDVDLNTWYGSGWTQTQPVLVINQLGVTPNLVRRTGTGGGPGPGQTDKGPDFAVNGQLKPVISMHPGEVQMWRIVNTSGRAGTFFVGPPAGFQWMQLAQDGVQFDNTNYQSHVSRPFLLAPGNRADLLVKAPAKPCPNKLGCPYPFIVQNEVDQSDLTTAYKATLLSVNVSGAVVDQKSHKGNFIPNAPGFPDFLADIKSTEVQGTKTIVFASGGPGGMPTPAMHTIDGKKFDGEVGEVVLLNHVEEWKVVNQTWNSGAAISHPFHIHINPFQIVEVFAPFEFLTDANGNPLIQTSNATGKVIIDPNGNALPANKYVFVQDYYNPTKYPGQCYLDPLASPDTWKPCAPPQTGPRIWWDTFPIPTGVGVLDANFQPVKDKAGNPINVPGYFKMRSRFVDYTGYYVIHCHILAHEDRGMMTVVEVAPAKSPYVHQ